MPRRLFALSLLPLVLAGGVAARAGFAPALVIPVQGDEPRAVAVERQ